MPNAFGTDDSVVDLTALETRGPRRPEPSAAPAGSNIEREAKLLAPPGLAIPDLNGLVPGATAKLLPVERLDATYYDTADLRLARSGITCATAGESGPPWTVKLPETTGFGPGPPGDPLRRPGRVSNAAADLVLAYPAPAPPAGGQPHHRPAPGRDPRRGRGTPGRGRRRHGVGVPQPEPDGVVPRGRG